MTLAEVYLTHFDFVFRSLRRLGVPAHALDDAVQDVFVVVQRRLHEFEGRSTMKTWLFGIARRVVRDHRTARWLAPAADYLEETTASPLAGPDESAENAESNRQLLALLDTLDDDKRVAFILVDLEELSVPEAAEALGENLNTIYSRVRAARRDLEQALVRRRAKEQWRARCAG
jgi:RNA polymerase sigma-70 factor (ECF subfamily)